MISAIDGLECNVSFPGQRRYGRPGPDGGIARGERRSIEELPVTEPAPFATA
ncbi:hypothetical protein ACWEOZ_31450 [Actinoplanes sp. NPDC004185]